MIKERGISEIQLLTIERIDKILCDLFAKNPAIREISATDSLPLLLKNGVFIRYQQLNGSPILDLLRRLEKENQLFLFRLVVVYRKRKNKRWYFMRQVKF